VLAGLLPSAGYAYTIIMRNGRRIEAPAHFVVTQTTLTYAAAPDLNVTLQLSQIDVAATEQANNEPAGSLLRRAHAHRDATSAPSPATVRRATRTLTNRELEPVRRARLESERAYEQRRKELGLPAPEEERQSAEAEAKALRKIARRHEAEKAAAENYWRERAATLRAETVALDAEIDYLRTRLADASDYFAPGYGAISATVIPFFAPYPFPFAASPGRLNTSGFSTGTQLGGSLSVGGGATRGHIFFNQQSTSGTFQRRILGTPGFFAPPNIVLAVPFNYANADAPALRLRLVELEAARAGLSARWQQLEDEARRAGALPGWLRP
jgi:murein DD-endopeptidase MepM/ murein hydrolase activator NlpD